MAIDVMIKRRFQQGRQAKDLVPLILHLRALATYQPGYISGTTLSNLERPDECLVVSRWESVDDWNIWRQSKQRSAIEQKIEKLTGEMTDYNIYAPLVPDVGQGQELMKKLGQTNIVSGKFQRFELFAFAKAAGSFIPLPHNAAQSLTPV